jgi:GH15 family glucan-1,4-alpha-glucosidase
VADERDKAARLWPDHELLREATCLRGEVALDVVFDPRPDYGRERVRWRDAGALGLRLEGRSGLYALRSDVGLVPRDEGGWHARVVLRAGETLHFSLTYTRDAPAVLPPLGARAREAIARSASWWRRWAGRARYRGPYRDAVVRSALALKLLSFAPSGAIIAAPTTSLPERPGGDLNWDYRYCWLRDAAFTARALHGYGRPPWEERVLGHLVGYGGAPPSRCWWPTWRTG